MKHRAEILDLAGVASAIGAEITALSVRNAGSMRTIRRKYSNILKEANPEFVIRLAKKLRDVPDYRWLGYELIRNHKDAFEQLDEAELEELGTGIDSWWTVDAFARILSGPAWLNAQVSDKLILKWARSKDRWWRRAALVSTVALNVRSQGGTGDIAKTLRVCHVLIHDHDDMVAKAMSWALRALAVHDTKAVSDFLDEHVEALASRVKREVRNKLKTGLKNPRRKSN